MDGSRRQGELRHLNIPFRDDTIGQTRVHTTAGSILSLVPYVPFYFMSTSCIL